MTKNILITGGAGFIGSHLTDELLKNNYNVRILDNLSDQVHGPASGRPDYLHSEAEFFQADIRDAKAVAEALKGIDAVFHFAAAVGVGQSMYQIEKYTSINNIGTAVLLEALIKNPVEKLVVASSMSIYGEGLYCDANGNCRAGRERELDQLKRHQWDLLDEMERPMTPLPTPETKTPALASIYAQSKYDQERMCLMVGRAYSIPTAALRFFNVYGTRQSLSNPYTGVMAIFASRLLNSKSPMIFEDGEQRRDFVSVYDVVKGCRLALETSAAAGDVFNIGSGKNYSVAELAERLCRIMGKEHIPPEITGKYRTGDIRHCFADISRARKVLRYEPTILLDDGLAELAEWLEGQVAVDSVEQAGAELAERGLTV
jgi:dTDP-L-rhamnose 4-epimerase